jgi:hypothetical protein
MDVYITLVPSSDEGDIKAPLLQSDMVEFENGLRAASIECSPVVGFQKSTGTEPWLIGQFVFNVLPYFSGVLPLLGIWVQARYGRKVRIKVGDIEVEATSVDEVRKLLKAAKLMRDDEE